jgi:hypothetical protein
MKIEIPDKLIERIQRQVGISGYDEPTTEKELTDFIVSSVEENLTRDFGRDE